MGLVNLRSFASKMVVHCGLIDAMYRLDRLQAEAIAVAIGGTVVGWIVNPATQPPDYVVITKDDDVLVSIAGTTNKDQWLAHLASGFVTATDSTTRSTAVKSFYEGEQAIENGLLFFMGPLAGKRLYLSGHSYGAAAAFILAVHLHQSVNRPRSFDLMTFGEPMSYAKSPRVPEIAMHARVIAQDDAFRGNNIPRGIDPVTLLPFPRGGLTDLPNVVVQGFTGRDANWQHRGKQFALTTGRVREVGWYGGFAGGIHEVRIGSFAINLPYWDQHLVAATYLPKAIAAYASGPRIVAIDNLITRGLGRALPIVPHVGAPPRTGGAVFSTTSGGVNCRVLLRVHQGNGTLSVRQVTDMRAIIDGSTDDTGAAFRARIRDREAWRHVSPVSHLRSNRQYDVFLIPRSDILDEYTRASDVPNRNAIPATPTLEQARIADANAAVINSTGFGGSWDPVRVPPTPQAALAQQAMAAQNMGETVITPRPDPAVVAAPIPKQYLASTAKIADQQYAVIIDGEAVVTFATKSRARGHARAYNRMIKNLREAWGFDIDGFAERLRGQLIELSGAQGLANGLTISLPGF